MITRIFMTLLLAIEDIIRLLIQSVHYYVSTIVHAFSLIPVCLVFCCTKKCVCSNLCSSTGIHCNDASGCSCMLLIFFLVVIVLILYYTNWIQEILKCIGIDIPRDIFHRFKSKNGKEEMKAVLRSNKLKAMSTKFPAYKLISLQPKTYPHIRYHRNIHAVEEEEEYFTQNTMENTEDYKFTNADEYTTPNTDPSEYDTFNEEVTNVSLGDEVTATPKETALEVTAEYSEIFESVNVTAQMNNYLNNTDYDDDLPNLFK